VPVFLVYQTVVVTEKGEAFFYRDIYGHDRSLDRALRKGYPYPR
jgi:murein L,D-transpeptidase YcbB/YkuD